MAGAAQTRVLNIVTIGEQRFLRSRASIGSGRCAKVDEPHDTAPLGDPIDHFPALVQCLAEQSDSAGSDGAGRLPHPVAADLVRR